MSIIIHPARSPSDMKTTKSLFQSYAAWLSIDLTFQSFSSELSSLPGKYAPPTGEILLARDKNDQTLGCVALRPLSGTTAEIKRMFVLPAGRGTGVGGALLDTILSKAKELGYEEVCLDTLDTPKMSPAINMYKKRGFREIQPYYETPLEDTLFLRKVL